MPQQRYIQKYGPCSTQFLKTILQVVREMSQVSERDCIAWGHGQRRGQTRQTQKIISFVSIGIGMAASDDFSIAKYSFVQAKRDFDNARKYEVPEGWEEYVDSSNKGDVVKIWRKADSAVRDMLIR